MHRSVSFCLIQALQLEVLVDSAMTTLALSWTSPVIRTFSLIPALGNRISQSFDDLPSVRYHKLGTYHSVNREATGTAESS